VPAPLSAGSRPALRPNPQSTVRDATSDPRGREAETGAGESARNEFAPVSDVSASRAPPREWRHPGAVLRSAKPSKSNSVRRTA
jgi:hypothetical protein